MNCAQARLELGAAPDALDAALRAHLAECPDCRRFRSEMQHMERDIRRVLPPVADGAGWALRPARRWFPGSGGSRAAPAPVWALAATLACVAVAAALLVGLRPAPALARDVVAHVERENSSWSATTAVPRSELARLLRQDAGVSLAPTSDVVYARSCWFHGRYVPHLVVRTASGPFTVMILRGEHVRRAQHFATHGYTGVLVPEPGGTIAVLGRGSSDPERVAGQIERALQGMG